MKRTDRKLLNDFQYLHCLEDLSLPDRAISEFVGFLIGSQALCCPLPLLYDAQGQRQVV
ncbi:MAG: hypothetical protein F6J87_11885 [Spirulina sp. SIO3F2]|nr:hypothetical protein [Spirulina sp. SIO3F2]